MRTCKYCPNPPQKFYDKNGLFKKYSVCCAECSARVRAPGPQNRCAKKGGRRVDEDGYVFVLDPRKASNKTGSKYIAEHRLVVEQKIGRPLETHEIVHHLNGIRDDNRPENLQIVDAHSHESRTYTKALQARILELEAELKRCQNGKS